MKQSKQAVAAGARDKIEEILRLLTTALMRASAKALKIRHGNAASDAGYGSR